MVLYQHFAFYVQGESIISEGPLAKGTWNLEGPLAKGTWTYGDFGEADPAVAEATRKNVNNWQMVAWGGMATFKGVLSDDGKKVTCLNFLQAI